MRTLLSTLALALVVGLAPTLAEAACNKTGTVVRVKMRNDGRAGSHIIYIRELGRDLFYWTARTADDEMANLAGTMVANRTRVRVKGTASACPTAGATGGKNIGSVIDFFAVP